MNVCTTDIPLSGCNTVRTGLCFPVAEITLLTVEKIKHVPARAAEDSCLSYLATPHHNIKQLGHQSQGSPNILRGRSGPC